MHGGFAPGSVSVGLYASGDDAESQVDSLVELTRAVETAGFDGVSVSEHHAGFTGYLPSPNQVATWLLGESRSLWVSPCPVLLPLRGLGLVAEEAAWTAARYPRRFALGLAPGYVEEDYDSVGAEFTGRQRRYWSTLPEIVATLSGRATGPLAKDPAVQRCAAHPIQVLTAAAGPKGAQRAGAAGAGIILGAFTPPAKARGLFDRYIAAGGTGPRVLIRRCWMGTMKTDGMRDLLREYQGAAGATGFLADGSADEVIITDRPEQLAEAIATVLRAANATALSLRFTFPGLDTAAIADQVGAVGQQALPLLRERLAKAGS